jgi:hypothetical protein
MGGKSMLAALRLPDGDINHAGTMSRYSSGECRLVDRLAAICAPSAEPIAINTPQPGASKVSDQQWPISSE